MGEGNPKGYIQGRAWVKARGRVGVWVRGMGKGLDADFLR